MALTLKPQRGRPPFPRVEFKQAFLDCLTQQPGWLLALAGGWRHYPGLSALLHQRTIPASPVTLERFYRLADALNFPRTEVFRESSR